MKFVCAIIIAENIIIKDSFFLWNLFLFLFFRIGVINEVAQLEDDSSDENIPLSILIHKKTSSSADCDDDVESVIDREDSYKLLLTNADLNSSDSYLSSDLPEAG